jgi:hypothetical protein
MRRWSYCTKKIEEEDLQRKHTGAVVTDGGAVVTGGGAVVSDEVCETMIFLWGFCESGGQECGSNFCFHKATSELPEKASKVGGLKNQIDKSEKEKKECVL